jgi:probable F420-dependent oxidoreductase
MKFGVRLYGSHSEALVRKAIAAEQLGFESLWRGDHLLIPREVASIYPYTSDGVAPLDPDGPVLDVLTVLAFVAQATSRIRLATGVLVMPLRHPVHVARAVGTLDVLSHGRAILGLGVGWLREEFELLDSEYSTRGKRTDEAIGAINALWTQADPVFVGEHYQLSGAAFEPKPVQRPRPPIVIGGESPRALRRAAELCDGWYGHLASPEAAEAVATDLRRRRAEADRVEPFEVTIRADASITPDEVRRFEDAGVDRVVLQIGSFSDVEAMEDVAAMRTVAERLGLEPFVAT